MPINLEIDDEQVELLREIYSTKSNEISYKIAQLQTELQKLTPILIQLGLKAPKTARVTKNGTSGDDYLNEDYNPITLTWAQKGMYILSKHGEMTAKQLIEKILKDYEPNLDRTKVKNSLPATMSVIANEGKINKRNGDGEFIYSIKEKTPITNTDNSEYD